MLLPIDPHSLLITDPTMTRARTRIDVGVLWCKFVASFAMRFLGIEAATPIDVHLRRNRLKVKRIAAATSPAKMVHFHTKWNWTYKELVGQAVNVDIAPLSTNDRIIGPSPSTQRAQPQPAASIRLDVNLFLNALRQSAQFYCIHSGSSMAQRPCWGQFPRAMA